MDGVYLQWLLFTFYVQFDASSFGLEVRDNACDPEFKANIEGCLRRLQGFPVLAQNKSFIAGDWRKTDVICRRQLIHSASTCVSYEFARCPQTQAWRSLCGFQSVQPELLLRYGQAVCKHREVLQQHWGCQGKSHDCKLKSCLDSYDASLTSRLTVGMLKGPRYSPLCSSHAYTEYCHEISTVPECPAEFYEAQQDIFVSSHPLSCSMEEIRRHKARYHENQVRLHAINSAADDWSRGGVIMNVIGGSILVFVGGAFR